MQHKSIKKISLIIVFFLYCQSFIFGIEVKDTLLFMQQNANPGSWISAELKLIEARKYIEINPEKAKKAAKAAELIGNKYNDLKLIASAKQYIGMADFYLDNPVSAIAQIQHSIKIYESINEKKSLSLAKVELGNIIGNTSDYQLGISMLESLINYFEEENDYTNLGKIYLYIGDIQKKERIYNYAVESFFKAISCFDKLHQDADKFYAMNEIASVFKVMKQYKIALKFYNQILDYTVSSKNINGQGAVLNNIADLYKELKDYDLALEYFEKAIAVTKKTNLLYNLAVVYNNKAKVEFLSFKYKNALDSYNEAFNLINPEAKSFLAVNILLNITEVYLAEKNIAQCKYYQDMIKSLISRINDKKLLSRYYDIMSKVNMLENNYKIALENRILYEKLNDSLNSEVSYEQISDIRIDYETRLKKKENELLTAENSNLKKNKLLLLVAILLIIIVFVSVVIVLILKYRNTKQKELIYRQDTELIKKELLLLKDDHEIGQKELVVNVLRENIAKESINDIIEELKSVSLKGNESVKSSIKAVIKKLDKNTVDDTWEKFEKHFSKVNDRFYINLQQKHPDLTPGEKRLCALLLINLSSKEIAAITNQTFRSVTTARYRLRQKLGLKHEDFIINYLESMK